MVRKWIEFKAHSCRILEHWANLGPVRDAAPWIDCGRDERIKEETVAARSITVSLIEIGGVDLNITTDFGSVNIEIQSVQ